jgi:hypothetical protein
MRKRLFTAASAVFLTLGLLLTGIPASADHTDPNTPQALTNSVFPGVGITRGEGSWQFIRNFAPNLGSDLKFFVKDGSLYSASGTLGQADIQFVGQRFLRIIEEWPDGEVSPTWVADHGSAKCQLNTAVTGLQHDQAVTPAENPVLLADSTDARGRCHDTPGGGLELVDISGLGQEPAEGEEPFEVREVRLIRHLGLSHTVTADPVRRGIFYNSTSDSNTPHLWIDIVDARSCMFGGPRSADLTLEEKRAKCDPKVYRLSWEDHPEWSQRDPDGEEGPRPNDPTSAAACHDITIVGDILYCASLNATTIFDIGGMFIRGSRIRGRPLPCEETVGTRTGALVTNCEVAGPGTQQLAVGWEFLGNYNHPGRPPGQQNNNLEVPADEGVSVSHGAEPTHDGQHLFVSDERGGGVIPPGATCSPGIDNPFGNGGLHVFDISQRVPDLNDTPENPQPPYFPYAQTVDGDKAIWRSEPVVPAATFCTVHMHHRMHDEERFFVSYYSQGIKVLDYEIDEEGRFTFTETASFTLAGTNSWAAQPFKIVDNEDGTRTYFLMSSDIQRGIDFLTWTGPTNPIGPPAPSVATQSIAAADAGLLVLGFVLLPAAGWIGRRRRSRAA